MVCQLSFHVVNLVFVLLKRVLRCGFLILHQTLRVYCWLLNLFVESISPHVQTVADRNPSSCDLCSQHQLDGKRSRSVVTELEEMFTEHDSRESLSTGWQTKRSRTGSTCGSGLPKEFSAGDGVRMTSKERPDPKDPLLMSTAILSAVVTVVGKGTIMTKAASDYKMDDSAHVSVAASLKQDDIWGRKSKTFCSCVQESSMGVVNVKIASTFNLAGGTVVVLNGEIKCENGATTVALDCSSLDKKS